MSQNIPSAALLVQALQPCHMPPQLEGAAGQEGDGLGPPIKEVIIVGAGIGGLTVANALRCKGIKVRVFERSDNLSRDTGAGCGLSQNGQMCLHSVGISHEKIMKISTPVLEHVLCVGDKVLARSDYPTHLFEKYGIPLTGTMRGDLINLLAEPFKGTPGAIQLGKKVTGVEQLPGSNRVKVTLASGETSEADLVIGADGINSTVAQHVLGEALDKPIYSGYSIFFGVIDDFHKMPSALPPPESDTLASMVNHPSGIVQALAPSKLFMVPGGAGPDKKLVWKLGYKTDNPPNRREWQAQPGKVRQECERYLRESGFSPVLVLCSVEMIGIYYSFGPDFPVWGLMKRTKDERLLHFGLYSRGHKDVWHKGRVVLLGDSAHATLPHVGQGANMAIEDGVVLTQCLEEAGKGFRDVEAALQEFYRRRRDRTRRIVDSSKYVGMFMGVQHPWAIWARDIALKAIMESGVYKIFAEKEIINNSPVPVRDPRQHKSE